MRVEIRCVVVLGRADGRVLAAGINAGCLGCPGRDRIVIFCMVCVVERYKY